MPFGGAGSFWVRPPDFVRLRLAEASGIADSTKGRISVNFCPKSNLNIVFSVIFRGAFEYVFDKKKIFSTEKSKKYFFRSTKKKLSNTCLDCSRDLTHNTPFKYQIRQKIAASLGETCNCQLWPTQPVPPNEKVSSPRVFPGIPLKCRAYVPQTCLS